jgi:serine/threonine protein kinase
VENKENRKIFAMKKLSKKLLMKKKMLKYAVSECKIMKDLNHPFILALHNSFENQNYIYLVLEFCPGGDLESLIENHPLSEFQADFLI